MFADLPYGSGRFAFRISASVIETRSIRMFVITFVFARHRAVLGCQPRVV